MTFGEKLKEARKAKQLTQKELAAKIGAAHNSISNWENNQNKPDPDTIQNLCWALDVLPNYFFAPIKQDTHHLSNLIPFRPTGDVPILGSIPAGLAALALEDIEGYTCVDVRNPEECFALRVKGDSMINAGIRPGDLVIIRYQSCADNGQIVACRVNGDEATLKRFKQQNNTVILLPENPNYDPIIVPCSDFDNGYASIIGVAIEVKRSLL